MVGGDDLAGVEVDDRDGGVVDEREDAFAAVGGSDAEVVHAAGAAETDLPVGVDVVVANTVVGAVVVSGRDGFGGGAVGGVGSEAAAGAVRSAGVVVVLGLDRAGSAAR